MPYPKYFKPGQKILLRAMDPGPPEDRKEVLTVYFHDGKGEFFDLFLPYGAKEGESYPFTPGMPFELNSEALGLGIRLTCRFAEMLRLDMVRMSISQDLQMFQRRAYPRLDISAGLRYSKGRGTLQSFRAQWEKNIRILEKGSDLSRLRPFPRCEINLSYTGIRIAVKPPVEVADLFLLYLELEPETSPICALAEVVWRSEDLLAERYFAGMRFVSILEADQKRIEKALKERGREPILEP